MLASSELARLHLITSDEVLASPQFLERARGLLERFGSRIALHLRARNLAGRTLFDLAERFSDVAAASVFVNDRVDVAMCTTVTGVQLRRDSLPVADARRLLGPSRTIGYSTHAVGESMEAARSGANFLIAGTMFETASHPNARPSGPALLAEIARSVDVPVLGIGGIDAGRVRACRAAGAHGVAVIRAVWSAADPLGATNLLLAELES